MDPSFWAEPFNAITNIGFIIGAAFALRELIARPKTEPKLFRYFLVLTVFVIGIGSFLFHTYATPWASAADVIPIGIFMLAYLGYALYAFAGLPLLLTLPAIAGFAWVIEQAMQVQCDALGFSLPLLQKTNCLNGSFGYLPALAAMLLIGAWLTVRRHPTAPYVLGASLVFMISVTLRATDRIWCNDISFMGKAIGTHFLWHMCNSTVLFLLVLAAVRHGAHGPVPAGTRQTA
ncbi:MULTISPECIES: ceramidase domain-containing protein [Rhodomicrobium]|uniref:ceramidase domain-containing protein n=1 Tax=Rhodomicrobium TaxID=1068 RepID=UPI0014825DC5|nr:MULTISPECIES: ceramidase domain-containing protein [Rhodomicrobium]